MKPKPNLNKALDNYFKTKTFTASEVCKMSPLIKLEKRILVMLKGLNLNSIETLLVHRVLPEAKRRAKL